MLTWLMFIANRLKTKKQSSERDKPQRKDEVLIHLKRALFPSVVVGPGQTSDLWAGN